MRSMVEIDVAFLKKREKPNIVFLSAVGYYAPTRYPHASIVLQFELHYSHRKKS